MYENSLFLFFFFFFWRNWMRASVCVCDFMTFNTISFIHSFCMNLFHVDTFLGKESMFCLETWLPHHNFRTEQIHTSVEYNPEWLNTYMKRDSASVKEKDDFYMNRNGWLEWYARITYKPETRKTAYRAKKWKTTTATKTNIQCVHRERWVRVCVCLDRVKIIT